MGRVRVRYANGTEFEFGSPVTNGSEDDNFGRALLARDLNDDGYTDLVVGDPAFLPRVFEIFGGPAGLESRSAVQLAAPMGVMGFGSSLAFVESATPRLVVGAPGSTGGSLAGGAIVVYELGVDGRPSGDPKVIGQGTPGLVGEPEVGDAFGSVLASTGSWLFIGVPREDLGRARDAGAVVGLDFDGSSAVWLTQDSPGVRTLPEAGDMFGLSLAAGDGHLVVGAPRENLGEEDVGIVQPFEVIDGGLRALPALEQGALPGDPETGDAFGWALAIARPCPGVPGILIGAPAEAIGTSRLAGSVWLTPFMASGSCPALQIYEGVTSEPPAATGNSLYGSAVSTLRLGADQADTLVVASAGVSEEGVLGRVLTLTTPYDHAGLVVMRDLRVHEERTLTLSPPAG